MNFDKVVNSIHSACEGKVTGFGFAIFTGKDLRRSGGDGFAVWKSVKFTGNTRMDLGSLGKTVTAAAVMHAIEHHQSFDLDDALSKSITKFLPPWPRHTSTEHITLHDLLTHHSGLIPVDGDIGRMSAIKVALYTGRASSDPKYDYTNLNFDCLRVMLPYLAKAADKAVLDTMPDAMYDKFSAEFYVNYIKENILAKCRNIPSSVTVGNSGPTPYTLYYWHPHEELGGVDSYDQFMTSGSGGWRMSAEQYGEFIVGLRHQVFFKEGSKAWKLMKENETGFVERQTSIPPNLKVWIKDGGWTNGHHGYRTAWIGVEDKQPDSRWPQAFTAVLVTNSRAHEGLAEDVIPKDVLLAAFESGIEWMSRRFSRIDADSI